MPIFAMFLRELRISSRGIMSYVLRLLLLLVTIIALYIFWRFNNNSTGIFFLAFIVASNVAALVLFVPSYFALAIGEEKDEKTLGLLLMTKLSVFSIILGKAVPRMLFVINLLLLQLPFVVLAISLGGVSLQMVLTLFLLFVGYTVFLNGVCLYFSVVCKKSGFAIFLSYLFIIAYEILLGRPYEILIEVFKVTYGGNILSPATIHYFVFGVMMFVLGYICFNNYNRGVASGAEAVETIDAKQTVKTEGEQIENEDIKQVVESGEPQDKKNNRGKVWDEFFVWKDFHFLLGGKKWMTRKIILFVFVLLLMAGLDIVSIEEEFSDFFTILQLNSMFFIILLFSAWEWLFWLCKTISWERCNYTLPSIVLLPHSVLSLVGQKIKSIFFVMIPNVIFVFILLGWLLLDNYMGYYEPHKSVIVVLSDILGDLFLYNYNMIALFFMISLLLSWGLKSYYNKLFSGTVIFTFFVLVNVLLYFVSAHDCNLGSLVYQFSTTYTFLMIYACLLLYFAKKYYNSKIWVVFVWFFCLLFCLNIIAMNIFQYLMNMKEIVAAGLICCMLVAALLKRKFEKLPNIFILASFLFFSCSYFLIAIFIFMRYNKYVMPTSSSIALIFTILLIAWFAFKTYFHFFKNKIFSWIFITCISLFLCYSLFLQKNIAVGLLLIICFVLSCWVSLCMIFYLSTYLRKMICVGSVAITGIINIVLINIVLFFISVFRLQKIETFYIILTCLWVLLLVATIILPYKMIQRIKTIAAE